MKRKRIRRNGTDMKSYVLIACYFLCFFFSFCIHNFFPLTIYFGLVFVLNIIYRIQTPPFNFDLIHSTTNKSFQQHVKCLSKHFRSKTKQNETKCNCKCMHRAHIQIIKSKTINLYYEFMSFTFALVHYE